MSPDERQKAFDDAVAFVYKAYPQMDGRGQLYDHWAECNYYQQHVINLADSFMEEHRASKSFRATWKFCELVNQSQRFLYETNLMNDLKKLCEINTIAVDTLDEADRRDDLKASVLSHQANLYESIGKVDQAIEWNQQAYQIRLNQKPPKYHLISSFENNLGFCYNTANKHDTAFEYFKKAEATWHGQGLPCPVVILKNMARGLLYLKRLDEARALLKTCIDGFRNEDTLNWAMVAYSAYFALGLIDRREGKFESAEATFIEAQNLWLKGDLKELHPFNGACMYKTGAVCLDQGKVEAAIKHLRDSIKVTEKHMKLMPVEHARSLFKLSEALTQDPQYESEAEGFRDKAEKNLRERDPSATDFGSEEPYDLLIPIFWR
ncbi:uncharacterized protein J4E84_007351 [Alternaria hordeiaustralica]|uniref:uncharacterized protein n=1 Tax=Alternaria hordeiaustralica TaxID=1187925 RepID=UPI0020C2C780|nr:uncharacterized protein J4E84_007351 [Alternaria hordeiaustralica]KAI4681756.1 hypothetical protein J4E84_007351 [Alternaria hordeiaustralica]